MKKGLLIIFLASTAFSLFANEKEPFTKLEWSEIDAIPADDKNTIQPGLAGAFIGTIDDVLIIAGGANFPDGGVWEGGQKVYHSKIYILEKHSEDDYKWFLDADLNLPFPIVYGLTIETEEGLLCIGGMNNEQLFSSVFLLSWDQSTREVKIKEMPSLPMPLANMSGGKIGKKVFVAASNGETKYFGSLDLEESNPKWLELPTWKGSPRTHAVGVVQNNGETDCFIYSREGIKRLIRQALCSLILGFMILFRINGKNWIPKKGAGFLWQPELGLL